MAQHHALTAVDFFWPLKHPIRAWRQGWRLGGR
jgi:hypothetical protein